MSNKIMIDSPGAAAIAAERARQMTAEGWTAEHDDEHSHGEIAQAAAYYLRTAQGVPSAHLWPFSGPPKKHEPLRGLVIAGALIAAEIDRLLRAQPPETCTACRQPITGANVFAMPTGQVVHVLCPVGRRRPGEAYQGDVPASDPAWRPAAEAWGALAGVGQPSASMAALHALVALGEGNRRAAAAHLVRAERRLGEHPALLRVRLALNHLPTAWVIACRAIEDAGGDSALRAAAETGDPAQLRAALQEAVLRAPITRDLAAALEAVEREAAGG